MKPLNAANNDGRVLLALRAGAMTSGEFAERGLTPSGWLIKEGLIALADGAYRITEAGRKACPLRNPLAAQPAFQNVFKPEDDMSRTGCITRQQVLTAIVEAGPAGTTPKALIERFDCADQVIYNHVLMLTKQNPPAIFKPEKGRLVAKQFDGKVPARTVVQTAASKAMHATREVVLRCLHSQSGASKSFAPEIARAINCTEESTRAVLAGLFAGLKINREKAPGGDFAYFIAPPVMETKLEKLAPACDQQIADSDTQPALTHIDEQHPPVPAAIFSETDITRLAESLEPYPEAEAPAGSVEVAELIEQAARQEPIQIPAVPDRRAPLELAIDDEEDFEVGVFSDGTLMMVIDDGLQDARIEFSPVALRKMRRFLGLFAETA